MLPSFAQAFASDNMSTTLPPIRKRAVKSNDDEPNANKKRRLTHSPHPHPLRIDLDNTKHQSNSTPISPIGFTVQREMIDHVRSVKQIRKKQEALIEQRRGSAAGLPDDAVAGKNSNSSHPSVPPQAVQNHPLSQPRQEQGQQQPQSSNSISTTTPTSSPQTQTQIQTSLPPSSASGPSSSRLPPPPISFANRAISAGKKKPADLYIVNPRDSGSHYPPFHPAASRLLALHGSSSLQPAVQSAPPSQNTFSIPMALPRLPASLISSGPPPTIAGSGRVPPTPTRLSMQGNSGSSGSNTANGKSPPASIPIATTLVPHTPTTLAMNRVTNFGNSLLAQSQSHPLSSSSSQHQPHNQNASASAPTSSTSSSSGPAPTSAAAAAQAKQAFLAPFELFYDALHDARQLKDWLNEQLTRTAVLMRRWEDQQNQLQQQRLTSTGPGTRTRGGGAKEKTVVKKEEVEGEGAGEGEGAAEGGEESSIREELEKLRSRVEELEGRLGIGTTTTTTTASSSSSTSSNSSHEGYTFSQQQQQRYEQYHQQEQREQHDHSQQQQQQQREYQPPHQREREHQEYQQPSTSSAKPASVTPNPLPGPPPLPSISGRLTVSGRPELARRLSSPGWHPSSFGPVGRSGYRTVGRGGDEHLEREREVRLDRETGRFDKEKDGGHAAVGVSKSLSGPGTSGSPGHGGQFSSGSQGGSNSRRGRGRRVSISGGVVPSYGANAGDGESGPEPECAAGQKAMGSEAREARPDKEIGKRERLQENGKMDIDGSSAGGGADGDRERERRGERKRELEREGEKGKDEIERDRERDRKEEDRR